MRIALVTETFLPSVDGVVTRLTKAVERFTELGHEVLVVAPDLGVRSHAGAQVEGIPAIVVPFYRHRPFAMPHPKVARVLAEFSPDVIHAAQPIMMVTSAARYARRHRIPLVASYHTHIPRYLDLYPAWRWGKRAVWWHIRHQHGMVDLNLVTSQSLREELSAQGIRRIEVLPRGVDTVTRHPRFASATMRDRLSDRHPEDRLLIFVGRLAAEKQIETLRPLLDRSPNLRLAIIGDGPYRGALERAFAGSNTVFTGFLRGDDLAAAFASADGFLFPSVTETLGLVIAEAMASGVPVIAAKSGPTLEQVTDGYDGLLYSADDQASLDHAVQRLDDPELVDRIRGNARAAAEAQSWQAASDALLEHYRSVLPGNHA
ncbi:glycosyltransferase [Naumannella halotolerans]|uniref:Glycosyltransferase involved in cell wall biosynthesis n=1 Tax=Naumannella halotolerans TaxID=993414 RepID=A0A4R7J3S7_9ACTN|nr:glycosyltransferase [Naumannella halotolerans]TDT31057.1 glycosyltransferase involved in cell wall biosynthesis [Naumannella halotolerans]